MRASPETFERFLRLVLVPAVVLMAGCVDREGGNPAGDDDSITDPAPTVDLAVSKTVDESAPTEGAIVHYTLAVTNAGPDPASGVELTDLWPPGLSYVSDDGGGAYVSDTGVWTVGNVAVAATAALTIAAVVDSGWADSTIVNAVHVTAVDQLDSDGTNDAGSVAIVVATVDPDPTDGSTYYVANDGDDSAPGTLAAPLRTVGAVNSLGLEPGDTVRFRSGDVFDGGLVAKHGVTYDRYGTGAKPRLERGVYASQVVLVMSRNDVTVRNLDVSLSEHAGVGVFGTSSNWRVEGVDAHHNIGAGIKISSPASNGEIVSCRTNENQTTGIAISGTESSYLSNVNVRGCESSDTLWTAANGEGAGLKAFGWIDSTIEDCLFERNGGGGIRLDGGLTWGCDRIEIRNTTCRSNGRDGWSAGNLQIEFSTAVTVVGCTFQDPVWGHNVICAHERTADCVFRDCVFEGSNEVLYAGGLSVVWGAHRVTAESCDFRSSSIGYYVHISEGCVSRGNRFESCPLADFYLIGEPEAMLAECDCNSYTGVITVRGDRNYTPAEFCAAFAFECGSTCP